MWSRITSIKLTHLKFPRARNVRTAKGEIAIGNKMLVSVCGEGISGVGEAPALLEGGFGTQSIADVQQAIERFFLPKLAACDPKNAKELDTVLDSEMGNYSAKAALSTAFWDWVIKRNIDTAPLGETISALTVPSTELLDSVSFSSRQDWVYPRLKASSLEEIKEIVSVAKSKTYKALIIDLNQSLEVGAVDTLNQLLSGANIFLEDPFVGLSIEEIARLRPAIHFKFGLDESIVGEGAIKKALTLHAANFLVLKFSRTGTLSNMIDAVKLANQLGVLVRLGGMFDTGVGRSVLLRVASTFGLEMPSDVSPPSTYLGDDVLSRDIESVAGGYVERINGDGLCPPLNESKLELYRDAEKVITL